MENKNISSLGSSLNPSKSNLTLTGRTSLNISGVKKIKSTEPNRVIAILDSCTIIINGINLSVQNISLSTGILDLTGLVVSINYSNSGKRKFSLKNLFK